MRQAAVLFAEVVFSWALALLVGGAVAVLPGHAAAHGGSPGVLGIVEAGSDGRPTAVRLNEGLAVRDGDVMRYVCPAAFGGEDPPLAQPLGDGALLVASLAGVYVLDAGEVSVREVASGDEGVAALLPGSDGPLLLRYGTGTARLSVESLDGSTERWSDVVPWTSAAPLGEHVHLARFGAGDICSLVIDAGGAELERDCAPPPEGFAAVFARADGTRPLLSLLVDGGLSTVVGVVEAGTFRELVRHGGFIYGPAMVDGVTRIVVNGELRSLEGDTLGAAVGDDTLWTCLGNLGDRFYGCDALGAQWLTAEGEATRAFELAELAPPRLSGLTSDQLATCELQWQRYRLDLISFGIQVGAEDAGAPDVRADAAPSDGADGAAQAPDAGEGEGVASDDDDAASGGCGCRLAAREGPGGWSGAFVALVGLLRARRRGRRGRRASRAR